MSIAPVRTHVLVCHGPRCLGQDAAGVRPIVRDALVGRWKRDRLYRHAHLSFTGCLGCCAQAPVVTVLHSGGSTWHGGCDGESAVEQLAGWVERDAGGSPPIGERFTRLA